MTMIKEKYKSFKKLNKDVQNLINVACDFVCMFKGTDFIKGLTVTCIKVHNNSYFIEYAKKKDGSKIKQYDNVRDVDFYTANILFKDEERNENEIIGFLIEPSQGPSIMPMSCKLLFRSISSCLRYVCLDADAFNLHELFSVRDYRAEAANNNNKCHVNIYH